MSTNAPPASVWDAEIAKSLIGAKVLVGLTYLNHDGSFDRQEQFFGIVESAESTNGIALLLAGKRNGERYALPPDTRAFSPAAPGDYRLRSTGEKVTHPDFTATWTITHPACA